MGTIKPDSKRSDQNPIVIRTYIIHLLSHMQHSCLWLHWYPMWGTYCNHPFTLFGAPWILGWMGRFHPKCCLVHVSVVQRLESWELYFHDSPTLGYWLGITFCQSAASGAILLGGFKVQSQCHRCWEFVLGVVVKCVCRRDPRTGAMILNSTEAAILRECCKGQGKT